MDKPVSEMDGFSEHQMYPVVHKELPLPEKSIEKMKHGLGFHSKSPWPWQIMLMGQGTSPWIHSPQVASGIRICCGQQFCRPVIGNWVLSLLLTERYGHVRNLVDIKFSSLPSLFYHCLYQKTIGLYTLHSKKPQSGWELGWQTCVDSKNLINESPSVTGVIESQNITWPNSHCFTCEESEAKSIKWLVQIAMPSRTQTKSLNNNVSQLRTQCLS